MDTIQTLIFDAGWLFFLAWAVVLAVMTGIAFRRDLSSFFEAEHIHSQFPQPPKIR